MKETYRNIKQIGLIGQEKNGMLLFSIYLTRMFKEPLHALVQGSSNAGKTYLLKKIINLLPKLHCKIITGMSENALFYVLEGLLKHVVLLLEDLQGSYKAFFVIRELMTNISLRKWITVSNPKTGELEQKELFVEGPTSIAGATTEDKIYEDNANRSFQIQIDENTERTNKILDRQLEEAAGLIDNEIESLIQRTFKTAQLQLKPVREFFRMNPMKLNRYLHELDARGYIKQTGGNKRTGYEYEIKVWGDYEQLQKGVEILDKILAQIAQKQNLPIDENQCLIAQKSSIT